VISVVDVHGGVDISKIVGDGWYIETRQESTT